MPHVLRLLYFLVLILALSSCNRNDKIFVSLPPSETNVQFSNTLQNRKAFGILYYLYYYNGGGVATGDINNDGLPDIYFTANSRGNNKLYLNKGNFTFEDITASAGVAGNADWCSGVTMADVNGDGLLDIYVSAVSQVRGLQGQNQLYINNGNNTFIESAAKYGLNFQGFTTQSAFFDFDHDGDLDCFILNQSLNPAQNIVDTSFRRKFSPYTGNYLFRNDVDKTGRFTDISREAGLYQSSLGYGLGLAVADLNNDGWEDLYVGNDFHENDYYYVNNRDGTFTESGEKHFNHYSRFSMGNDVADYNNDGQPDVITVDMLPPDEKVLKTYGSDENPDIYQYKIIRNGFQYQYSRNCLQRNNGDGTSFSEVGLLAGLSATDWSWAPLFADFDNDGNKDLFISSGIVKRPVDLDYVRFISKLYQEKAVDRTDQYDNEALDKMPDGASHPFLFKGDGNAGFENVSDKWGTGEMNGYFNGSSYADLDNDGNLDLVINCLNAPASILKNQAERKNFISVSFRGSDRNTAGIGGKVYLFQRGNMQYQQLMLTRGFQSSSDTRLHFGIDTSSLIDSLVVVWPGQQYQVLRNVKPNQFLAVSQKDASGVFDQHAFVKPAVQYLSSADSGMLANWKHRENRFDDFNMQYLIPHAESTRGPKIAVADVNGDGLDDFYACGARGQAGRLMVQQSTGRFNAVDTTVFNIDVSCEDVDAIFFDSNGDGHPDLYVVSGGNEETGNSTNLLDRLYLNDGKGHFSKSVNSLPPLFQNKSCVAVADIDRDGDQDVFVGTLADARAYGVPQTSYLLVNDGKGHFSVAGNELIPLTGIGLVNTGLFTDLDRDGWPDLVIAGEWMPVSVFMNRKGRFELSEVNNSTGWWQALLADDVNGDGYTDLLAGNWGWNNKFHSGKNGPVKMYVSDFDKNGHTDQLLSYTLNGEEYPFLAKDEVERALPLLRKHYLLYAEYADVPMKDVFYGWIDTIKPKIAERLGSAILYGNGKGAFEIADLPAGLQLSPTFSFQKIPVAGKNLYLSGGNFFDVIPYEGRYDAAALTLFEASKNNEINFVPQPVLSELKGQVRDIKWLRTTNNQRLLVAAVNNDSLKFFRVAK